MSFHPSALSAFRRMLLEEREEQGGYLSREAEEGIAWHAQTLEQRVPTIVSFPADAQVALLRWAWVNGSDSKRFPALFDALRPKRERILPDFDQAAVESVWADQSFQSKLIMTQLFHNATDVLNLGMDIEKLVYPEIISSVSLRRLAPPAQSVAAKAVGGLMAGGAVLFAAHRFLGGKVTAEKVDTSAVGNTAVLPSEEEGDLTAVKSPEVRHAPIAMARSKKRPFKQLQHGLSALAKQERMLMAGRVPPPRRLELPEASFAGEEEDEVDAAPEDDDDDYSDVSNEELDELIAQQREENES